MMTLGEAFAMLEAAGSLATVGNVVFKISEWLKGKKSIDQPESDLQRALSKLPADATVDDVVRVLEPFYRASGQITLKAGDDNGGDLIITGLEVKAGPGAGVKIAGGNGGANGKGGTVTLSNSRIAGGDAL